MPRWTTVNFIHKDVLVLVVYALLVTLDDRNDRLIMRPISQDFILSNPYIKAFHNLLLHFLHSFKSPSLNFYAEAVNIGHAREVCCDFSECCQLSPLSLAG